MQNFWEANLQLLRKKNQNLYEKVRNYSPDNIGEIIPTKTLPNLRFYEPGEKYTHLYTTDDPLYEIENKLGILHNKSKLNQTVCIFTGMGLGYNQLIALKSRPDIFKIMIIEPSLDMFCFALKYTDLTALFLSDKVSVFAGDIDWKEFDSILSRKVIETDFFFSDYIALFDWKPELYNETKNRANAYAVRAISGVGVLNVHGEQLFRNRIRNMTLFREALSADILKGAFKDKPAVVISAGPSLDKSIEQLKLIAGKCVMIAVDSAAVPLINNGIIPDFVATLDYREHNSEKLSPDLIKDASFSLVANITSSPLSPRRLPLKHLFLAFQDNDTQSWLMDALNVHYKMPPVGTVASLALTFAQMIEADPVIFVGFDFALTSEETDHVAGVVFNHGWHLNKKLIAVKSVHGGYVNTLDFLLEFKQNFEQIIKLHKRNYINSTASGAYIEGTSVQALKSVMEQYLPNFDKDSLLSEEMSVDSIVESAIQRAVPVKLADFISSARSQINIAQKTLTQVNAILNLNEKIEKYLQKNKNLLKGINNFSQLPSSIQQNKQKLYKLHSKLKPFMPMEEVAAKKISEAKTVQEVEQAETYMEIVAKEAKMVGLEIGGHHHGLTVFIEAVGQLVSFLEKEDKLLKRIRQNNYVQENDFIELAELYLTDMDPVKAYNALELLLRKNPDSPEAIMLMGVAHAQMLNLDNSLSCWQIAVKEKPELADKVKIFRYEFAEYWIQRGKAEAIIIEKCIRRTLKICNEISVFHDKDIKLIWWATSASLILKYIDTDKNLDAAKSFLDLWQPICESTPQWYYLMSKLFYEKNLKSESLAYIELALLQEPNNAQWLAFLARLKLENEQFDKGIEALEKAVKLDPSQAVLWEELGDTLFVIQDYSTAAIAYEKCFIAIPDKIDVLRKFGDCYFHTGQFEAAKLAYKTVLDKDANNEKALLNLNCLK